MPISKIVLDNQSKENVDFDGEFVRVPHGSTAQRPSSPAAGQLRFNTDLGTLEQYNTNTNNWAAIDSPPIISTLAYSGSNNATDTAGGETITLTGSNFKSGFTVTIGGTSAASTTFVNSTTVRFTTPAKTAGDYDVVFTNSNGLAATLTNGISVNGTPSFSTAAGNLGSLSEDIAMSTITIVASEPDSGTLAFSITSGALPAGVSLGSSNGQLTGTPNTNITANTTFNFTVTATDDENQTNSRAFNLIVLRPVYAVQIAKSIRLNDNAAHYLYKSAGGSDGNRTTWTWSGWVKRTNIGADVALIGAGADSNNRDVLRFTSANVLEYQNIISGTSKSVNTTAIWRDTTAWMHIVLRVDTTQASSSNRIKIYVNGQQQTLTGNTSNWHAQNSVTHFTSNDLKLLGARTSDGSSYTLPYSGYIAHTHLIDGTSLAPTSFGETHNGVWVPKNYNTSDGAYGTQGFFFDFADDSAIGDDESGNSNDWATGANLAPHDVLLDTPTNNFCTLNSQAIHETVTLLQGGLYATGGNGTAGTCAGTFPPLVSGKWYFEHRLDSAHKLRVGFRQWKLSQNLQTNYGFAWSSEAGSSYTYAFADEGGSQIANNEGSDGGTFAIIGHALDLDSSPATMKFYRNGTLIETYTAYNKDIGYTPIFYDFSGSGNNISIASFNFGQNPTFNGNISAGTETDSNGLGLFKHAVPSGYLAMCSKNLATNSKFDIETDDRPEDYFDTILYQAATSNGTYTHGNISFQADLAWIKCRDAGERYFIIDSVRGNQAITNKFLTVNMDAEGANGVSGTTFTQTATGYQFVESSIGSGELYYNNRTYVGWNWKAGGAPSTDNVAGQGAVPTAGSSKVNGSNRTAAYTGITSPKRQTVNTKAGFSITRYTGNATGSGAANSVDHGFTVQPEMIWIKGITGSKNWIVYSKYLSDDNSYFLYLNGNDDEITTSGDMWNGLSPTTSVVHMGYEFSSNQNNVDYMMYAWHSVEGYSKIGKYEGTSTTADAPFVHCGFKPAFVMLKKIGTNGNGSWFMLDNKRSPSNQVVISLSQGTPNDVTDSNFMDFCANGFKIRTSGGAVNTHLHEYLFMAFAENPYKYATAR